jgi:hypothetical protein
VNPLVNISNPLYIPVKTTSKIFVDILGGTKITATVPIEWFSPKLTNNRKITGYDVQFCNLIGGMRKNINFENLNENEKSVGVDFLDLRTNVLGNRLDVDGLKGMYGQSL